MFEVRIDKWMWVVCIFKICIIVVEVCKKGWISINGLFVKVVCMIKFGDVI